MNASNELIKEILNAFDTKPNTVSFSKYDSAVFFVTIFVFNILCGIYFNYFARRQTTTGDYLMGGRSMRVFPIAVSLVASHTSANTLLSVPADVYKYGAAYFLGGISTMLLTVATIYIYLPVFYNLRITSIYEYLEQRFDYKTRLLASFLSILSFIFYMPIVIYVPSLAFSAATGVNVHFMAIAICALCLFYTTIGGLKAVVWTDTIQFIIAMIALVIVLVLGLKSVGGFSAVWKEAIDGHRLDIFDFDVDPTRRDGFWSIIIGLTAHRLSTVSVGQGCVQKFLAVSTFRQSVMSCIYFGIGTTIVKSLTIFLGLIMYAKYADCDPHLNNKISNNDQLATYFVMDISRNIPGLSGLFIAGIFSASLSTLSAELNCLSGIIYEDFISKLSRRKFSEKDATFILKVIVIVCGILSTMLVYVVEHLGGLFSLAISLGGVTGGSILGMFTMGVLIPISNSNGAFYGGMCGLLAVGAIIFPAQYYQMQGFHHFASKPLSTKGCSVNGTVPVVTSSKIDENSLRDFPPIFKISFYYYALLGTCATVILGVTMSLLTKEETHKVDDKYISPLFHKLLGRKEKDIETHSTIKQS